MEVMLFWKALIITNPKTKPIKVVINNPTPKSDPFESPSVDFMIMKADIMIRAAPINPSAIYILVNTWLVAICALVSVGAGVTEGSGVGVGSASVSTKELPVT